ncbi:MAG: hypothetical protein IT176_08530 [Acidobacteria bacterium]|nr:hypothetical protein [Acidobacteriota bacterium]
MGWIGIVLAAIAVPGIRRSIDQQRTVGAVRYLATQCARARMVAITQGRDVALQFTGGVGGYTFAMYADGNGDGVRTRDIERGVDVALSRREQLSSVFAGVSFGVPAGLPPVDTGPPTDGDPLKLGAGNLLSFSARGTSSSGSLYVRGETGAQYVLRAYGETGKTRVLAYDPRSRTWRLR